MSDRTSKTTEIPAAPWGPATESDHGDAAPATQRFSSPLLADDGYGGAATERAISIPAPATRDRATLTIITGLNAGQIFRLDESETIVGRGTDVTIPIEDAAISRRHLCFRRGEDGKFTVEDLGSTNGTFVRGLPLKEAELASGDRIQIGPNMVLRFAITDETEEALLRRLYESSTRDALTGAFNRKYFCERLTSEVAYAQRHRTALAVLMLDVDHFKQVNDVHGHLTGDQALRALSATIARTIRREDVFARYGGEEFAVLARSAQPVDAEALAERLRAVIEQLRVPVARALLPITVSIGVASLAECPGSAGDLELIALADERLYRAKAQGRNRVNVR